jgi:hypothetical protein
MRADIRPVAKQAVAPASRTGPQVRYLNGGGARKHLPVKLRAQLEPHYQVEFRRPSRTTTSRAGATMNAQRPGKRLVRLAGSELKLDANGAARSRIGGLPQLNMPHNLRVEMEYADPNGEIQTVSRTTALVAGGCGAGLEERALGCAPDRPTQLTFQAVDLHGKPVAECTGGSPADAAHQTLLAPGPPGRRLLWLSRAKRGKPRLPPMRRQNRRQGAASVAWR